MASYDFSSTRLCVDAQLYANAEIGLTANQCNYVRNVIRLNVGDGLLLFNGREGEWAGQLIAVDKRRTVVRLGKQIRPQQSLPDVWYMFAPLKHARLDYMVQKAVEMGASRLQPVMTRRTQAVRVNVERMRANSIEAAEQCGIIALADICEPRTLANIISDWPVERGLVFCDENATPAESTTQLHTHQGKPLAVLIGPEGGFDPAERDMLLRLPQSMKLSLGPRILRADTAAVAALTLVQSVCGDWGGAGAGGWRYF
jgi:16S rRNA (uracil1498-N3)-methyltransferase